MLVAFFLLTAMLYASVGFGGGSTYNALLILANTDYTLIPIIALSCNILVVSGNSIKFYKHGLIPWRFTIFSILISMPFAWLGGNTVINKESFTAILGIALLLSGGLMLLRQKEILLPSKWLETSLGRFITSITSLLVGYTSGLVGIGGGIFFSPILHLSKALPTRNISAFASIFILMNSISGLLGQLMKDGNQNITLIFLEYAWLLLAVFIGGQIGLHLNIKVFQPILIRRFTALLIIYVSCRMLLLSLVN
ncbi:sulfite exporter TauE/SafE family protein [Gammaproteobacteria bacterium]|nr:sulfite exporter TauE/SafE family protein [Gammaproteobacteria bacterium]